MINTCDMEWYRVVQKYAALHEVAWSEAESIWMFWVVWGVWDHVACGGIKII